MFMGLNTATDAPLPFGLGVAARSNFFGVRRLWRGF